MLVGPKGLTIITILMGLITILFAGLALTATSKYRTQRHRVTELEEKLLAGRAELVKIPQIQLQVQEEQRNAKEKEEEIVGVKDELESLQLEYDDFKHEHELLAVAKAVSDRELQQREIALQEARATVAALDDRVKELEDAKVQLERQIKDLDLDYRAALTKIKNLEKERVGGGSVSMPPQHETVSTTPEAGSELQGLRAKVSELTNELVTLTKEKQQAERIAEELQRRLAALPTQ